MFDNNFGKCGPIFKTIYHLFVGKCCMRFPSHLQYIATLRCESRKFKNVDDFDNILNKLLTRSSGHTEDFI